MNNPGSSSGRLISRPFFARHWNDLYAYKNYYWEDRQKFYEKSTVQFNVSQQFVGFGSNLGYKGVQITREGQGEELYEFEFPGELGSIISADGYKETWAEEVIDLTYDTLDGTCYYFTGAARYNGYNKYPFAPNPNFEWNRGAISKRTDLNEKGNKVREINYEYDLFYSNNISPNILHGISLGDNLIILDDVDCDDNIFGGEKPCFCPQGLNDGIVAKYDIFTGVKKVLSTKTEKIYDPSDNENIRFIENISKYYYNDLGYLDKVSDNSGTNQEITRSFVYPYYYDKYNSNGSMVDRNIIKYPIEVITSTNQGVINSKVTDYDCIDCQLVDGEIKGGIMFRLQYIHYKLNNL